MKPDWAQLVRNRSCVIRNGSGLGPLHFFPLIKTAPGQTILFKIIGLGWLGLLVGANFLFPFKNRKGLLLWSESCHEPRGFE